MGRLVERAAAAVPAGWLVCKREKRGLFFTVTFYRVFAIDRNRIWVAFTTSEADADLKAIVEKSRVWQRPQEGFKTVDDSTGA
jgi:hypothetical protein